MNSPDSPMAGFGPGREDVETGLALEGTAPQGPPTVLALLDKAVQHGISVEGLERLLAMHERMKADQAREAFFEALSAFQAECPVIGKDRQVRNRDGTPRYRYAALEDIMRIIVPHLRANGLSVRFDAQFEATPPAQVITCIVNHRDGHSERSEFRTPIDSGSGGMNAQQASASALTYGRRYALLNALGIVVGGEDDDGQGAGRPERGVSTSRVAPGGTTAVAPQPPAPAPAAPRPLGRNLVRVRSQGSQGSDGPGMILSSESPTLAGQAVAETPAAPESAAEEAKAELRMDIIKAQMTLLRLMTKYADWPDDDLWEKAVDVADATCKMHYSKALADMSRVDLERARQRMNDTVRSRTGNAA